MVIFGILLRVGNETEYRGSRKSKRDFYFIIVKILVVEVEVDVGVVVELKLKLS